MKRRLNPLPQVVRSGKGNSIDSTTIMRENADTPLGLRVFLGVVLGRMAMHYTSTSILAQDALEAALNTLEAFAVGEDIRKEELCELAAYASERMEELRSPYRLPSGQELKAPWAYEIDAEDQESFSLWAIVYFDASLACNDSKGGDAMLRHAERLVNSWPKRSNDVRYVALSSAHRAKRAIANISRGILERKNFPRELLIGLDPERTNAILYEALLKRKR